MSLLPVLADPTEPTEPVVWVHRRMQNSHRASRCFGKSIVRVNLRRMPQSPFPCRQAHHPLPFFQQEFLKALRNMSHGDVQLRSMDQVATILLEQLGCCCGTCPEITPLPSVESVMTVVHGIQEILFPGIHGNRRLHHGGAATDTVNSLTRIQSRLRMEISRALVHARQIQLRLHNGAAPDAPMPGASGLADQFLNRLPELQKTLSTDVDAAFNGDPAAKSRDEIVLCYPGIEAITIYRIAHELLNLGVPYLPRIMTEWAHRRTGIDIHPGAKIGAAFFIDHGTGVVIGETSEIGSGVTLYQGVTLGAWSFPRDEDGNLIRGAKRHPTLEDRVTVYSNATILGGTTVIGAGSQIGSSVSLNRSVPPNTIVTIEKPSLRFREAA